MLFWLSAQKVIWKPYVPPKTLHCHLEFLLCVCLNNCKRCHFWHMINLDSKKIIFLFKYNLCDRNSTKIGYVTYIYILKSHLWNFNFTLLCFLPLWNSYFHSTTPWVFIQLFIYIIYRYTYLLQKLSLMSLYYVSKKYILKLNWFNFFVWHNSLSHIRFHLEWVIIIVIISMQFDKQHEYAILTMVSARGTYFYWECII